MEWLQNILKGIAEGKTAEEIQKEIQKEIPKHFKPASEFNTLNENYKTLKTEKDTLENTQKSIQTEYENYKKGSISQEDYEAKIKEIQEKAQEEVKATKKENAIDMYLINAKARNIKSVKALLNLDNVTQDGENLLGLKEQVDNLIEKESYLFDTTTKINNGVGDNNNPKRKEGEEYSDDELDNLSDEEYFARLK